MTRFKNGKWVLFMAQADIGGRTGTLDDPKDRLDCLSKINIRKDLDEDDLFFYYNFKGRAYDDLGKINLALENYTKSLDNIVPSKMITNNCIMQLYIWRGNIYFQKGEFEKALADYKEVYKRDDKDKDGALLEQAKVYIEINEYNKARDCLHNLAERMKGSPNFKNFWKKEIDKILEKIMGKTGKGDT